MTFLPRGGVRLRAQAAIALLLVLVSFGRGGAQTPPDRPPNTPDAYVLLGLSKIDSAS